MPRDVAAAAAAAAAEDDDDGGGETAFVMWARAETIL
jgi:hypothetical protein